MFALRCSIREDVACPLDANERVMRDILLDWCYAGVYVLPVSCELFRLNVVTVGASLSDYMPFLGINFACTIFSGESVINLPIAAEFCPYF